jgi:hypothetical protein
MDHATKVHTLAHMLAHGHGGTAPFVAVARARECREARDYESALLWLEVALLVGRDFPCDFPGGNDAEVSGGACHDALVTMFRRRRHHKPSRSPAYTTSAVEPIVTRARLISSIARASEPSRSIPQQASSRTTTSNPARIVSSAE